MGFLTRNEDESRLHKLHYFLKTAFEKVKNDTSHIFEWVNYFHGKHQEHDKRFDEIETQIYHMPGSKEEIRQMIDNHYAFDNVHAKMAEINRRLDALESRKEQEPVETRKYEARERLIKRVVRNSKNYVVSVIFDMIQRYGKIKASQLKEIIVDEQGLCSKSSFYRVLSELENDDRIGFLSQGKEKTYLFKEQALR
ncbi:hypothetical protein KY317_02660 [Candidatus Woesearchaeota archaeon]|nr:hypothetical protein [Candidatus Woesearchaeota archaeon]